MATAKNSVALRAQHGLNQNESAARVHPRLSGRGYVPASDCSYPPTIETQDVLAVDFDHDRVGLDGLYLVEVIENDQCAWRGCRRFTRQPGRTMMDMTGQGDWVPLVGSTQGGALRIVGRVEGVYRRQ